MKKLTLFNHKGGVGKTTLTVNIADALGAMGHTVLLIDADPQCNLTSYYLGEKEIDQLLGESDDDDEGDTMWSAIKPVVRGRSSRGGTSLRCPSPLIKPDVRISRIRLTEGVSSGGTRRLAADSKHL